MSKAMTKASTALRNAFKTDASLETSGVIFHYPGLRLTIARAGGANTGFSTLLNARLEPHARAMANKTMDNEVAATIMRECYADKIVLASEAETEDGKWVPGCINAEGDIIQANRAGLCEMFKEFPELFRTVQTDASDFANYRAERIAAYAKN